MVQHPTYDSDYFIFDSGHRRAKYRAGEGLSVGVDVGYILFYDIELFHMGLLTKRR